MQPVEKLVRKNCTYYFYFFGAIVIAKLEICIVTLSTSEEFYSHTVLLAYSSRTVSSLNLWK